MLKIKRHLESLGYEVSIYGKHIHATSKSPTLDKYVNIEKGRIYIISFAEAIEGMVRNKRYEAKDYREVIDLIKY